jgi:hypothetical protein
MKTYPFHPVLTRALFLAVLVLASSSTQAQVLLDGGFESPRLAPNSVQSGAGTVWTVSSGGAIIVSNNYESLGVTPYGTQYLSLNARSSVSQTISGFVTGETYVLGADFADLGISGQTFTLSISGAANGSLTLPTLVAGPYGSGTIPFQSSVIIFQATSNGSATVTLADGSAGGSLAVDNVALYGDPVPIPEPSTWALFLSCLGLLIWHFGLRRDAAVFRA